MIKRVFRILVPFFLVLSSSVESKNGWELSKQEEGIQVFVLDTPGSALKSFKGITTIPGKLTALVVALKDTKAFPRFLHNCKSASSLKVISDNESYKYIVTNMPWPVKNRDAIVHSTLHQDEFTKRVEIQIKAAPDYLAIKPGVVRIRKMTGRWILMPTGSGSVTVTYEMSVDPAGRLPKWLVNTMAVDIPFYTLKKLRKLVKEPVYQNAKRDYITE